MLDKVCKVCNLSALIGQIAPLFMNHSCGQWLNSSVPDLVKMKSLRFLVLVFYVLCMLHSCPVMCTHLFPVPLSFIASPF